MENWEGNGLDGNLHGKTLRKWMDFSKQWEPWISGNGLDGISCFWETNLQAGASDMCVNLISYRYHKHP